jgi:biopolymer transport protein ExbB/biopolymer transport protein TolQ
MQWTELWEHLGWPAIVVASVLSTMGVASLTVFAERLWVLRRSRSASRAFAVGAWGALRPGTVDEVVTESERLAAGHLARLAHFSLSMYRDAQGGLDGPGLTPVEHAARCSGVSASWSPT